MQRKKSAPIGNENPVERRKYIGIFGRLFLYLMTFTLFVLFLIWIFQIWMLDPFYQKTKHDELNRAADALSYFFEETESIAPAVYDYASRYDLCVSVYRIDGAVANEIAKSHVSGACAVHLLTDAERSELFDEARENGGMLSLTYPVVRQFIEHDLSADEDTVEVPEDSVETNDDAANDSLCHLVEEESINAVSLRIVKNSAGDTYILMLDSMLTPMSAVISTLEMQFLWLAAILIVTALLLSFLISRVVSRPIVAMNASAKRLAEGEYGVVFADSGFRESRELARTLNYAAVELSKTDTLQKELIANISNDLRTPLTMIKGYSEVMRDIPGENTPENVQAVIDEAERMSELVNDLLDLSKLRAGSRTAVPELFDLTETVRETIRRYKKLVEHEGYTIDFHYNESAFVYADRTMILQVLYNLINNAVNYTGEDKSVTVIETVSDGCVRISVTDTGEGIAKEQLPRIWDRYYREDKVHKRAPVGTGAWTFHCQGRAYPARCDVRRFEYDGEGIYLLVFASRGANAQSGRRGRDGGMMRSASDIMKGDSRGEA